MVVSNKNIVKTNIFPLHSTISPLIKVNNIPEDINMNKPRGISIVSSKYNSRELSTHSDIFSIPDINKMEA